MAAEPSLTVCIPTFNKSRFLRESIQSVMSQAFADYELVVIDDASTDDTPSIVSSFRDQRIRYIRHEGNIRLPANFDECLRTGRCEFIIIFHDDDIVLRDLLGREFEVLYSVTVVRQRHAGVSVARNHGIQISRGSVLIFMEADSWWRRKRGPLWRLKGGQRWGCTVGSP
jgi:glycosyltransferase involved in cell wall biosynthesis